ncbi:MAG: hypothetical protein LBI45_00455 [Bacteroidales bacterium]|jgi:hypothetical protein|nr:hypothetical protein [Bacteroidales bacterium]
MKRLFSLLLFICIFSVKAQNTFTETFDEIFKNISRTEATTGILYERVLPFARLQNFNSFFSLFYTSRSEYFIREYSESQNAGLDDNNQLLLDSDSCLQPFSLIRVKFFCLAYDMSTTVEKGIKQSILKKEDLQNLLSENQFKTYKQARSYYVTSVPLLSIGAGYLAAGSACLIVFRDFIDSPFITRTSIVIFGVASACLIPGTVLIIYSSRKLNKLSNEYNTQSNSSYQSKFQINIIGTQNGIGFKMNF